MHHHHLTADVSQLHLQCGGASPAAKAGQARLRIELTNPQTDTQLDHGTQECRFEDQHKKYFTFLAHQSML